MPLNTLSSQVLIVDTQGRPTPDFQRAWQNLGEIAENGGVAPGTYVQKGVITGWSSATGAAARNAFATYAAPAISNPPTQAQVQALANHVEVLSQHLKGLIDDLKTLGVINL